MNIKERIKKEIAIQKSIEGDKCQDKLLLNFLSVIKLDSQWRAFVNCELYHYGKISYESHRFYYPRQELLDLFNIRGNNNLSK